MDTSPEGFRWVVGDDRAQSVFAWLRLADGAPPLLMVANLTPVPRFGYRIGVPVGRLVARGPEHRCRGLWRLRHGQWRTRHADADRLARPAGIRLSDAAAARHHHVDAGGLNTL